MRYELEGTLKVIKPEQVISDRFKKREFVVQIDEESQFPQPVICQFTQDRCSNLDGYKEGDRVKVSFYIKGREWASPSGEIKYFVSLDAWNIEHAGGSSEAITPSNLDDEIPLPPSPMDLDTDDPDDDLPF